MSNTSWKPQYGVLNGGIRPMSTLSPYAQKLSAGLKRFADRFDAWTNPVTGFGTDRDKTTYGYLLPNQLLTDQQSADIYHHDDMAARMVDVVPQEALREPFAVKTGHPDLDALFADKFEALQVRERFADGWRWGRAFGGGAVLIGAEDGQDASKELKPARAKDLTFLYDVDRRYLWPSSYYDEPNHPKLGQPRTYMVTTIGGYSVNTENVHESRLIIFGGTPTAHRERMMNRGWSYSVLQRAYNILRQFNSGWTSVENMLTDGSQAVYKMAGLVEMMGAEGGQELISARVKAMDFFRSVVRAIVVDVDAKEDFSRQSTSFEQIPQVLDKFMLRLAATVEIPVTILMGQSPAGMNATGESDLQWFHNRIRAQQTTILSSRIRRLASVWLQTKAGQAALEAYKIKEAGPRTLTVKFPPLWSETPSQKADRKLKTAQSDAVYLQSQVFTPEEVALTRGRAEGNEDDIQLDDEALEARRESMVTAGSPDAGEDIGDEDATTTDQVTETASLDLTPSDLAAITKVNEARARYGLSPLPGADGQLTLPAFKAKYSGIIAKAANAEAGAPTGPQVRTDAFMRDARFDAGPLTFKLLRDVDETGVSGTGEVAHGVLFADGKAVLRWQTATASTTMFDTIDDVIRVHGHAGKTRIVWDDPVTQAAWTTAEG